MLATTKPLPLASSNDSGERQTTGTGSAGLPQASGTMGPGSAGKDRGRAWEHERPLADPIGPRTACPAVFNVDSQGSLSGPAGSAAQAVKLLGHWIEWGSSSTLKLTELHLDLAPAVRSCRNSRLPRPLPSTPTPDLGCFPTAMARSATVTASNGASKRRDPANGTASAKGASTEGGAAVEAQLDEAARRDFFWTYTEEPHRTRRLAIIKAHPEVRSSPSPPPLSARPLEANG